MLGNDENAALDALAAALPVIRERWEPETTARNLRARRVGKASRGPRKSRTSWDVKQLPLRLREALQELLHSPSALARARASLAYLPDMSRDSLRGFAHLGLLATLLQTFLSRSCGEIKARTRQKPGLLRISLITAATSRIALLPSPRNEEPCITARVFGRKAASRSSVLSVYGV